MLWRSAVPPDSPLPLILIFGAVFAIILSVSFLIYDSRFGPRAKLRKRVAMVTGAGVRLDKGSKDSSAKKKQIQEKLKEIENTKKRSPKGNQLKQNIHRAGLEISLQQYFMLGAGLGFVVVLLYLVLGYNPWGGYTGWNRGWFRFSLLVCRQHGQTTAEKIYQPIR